MRAPLALCLALATALPVAADPSGPLRVIDGDTIEVAGVTIRLFGIDAPEADQTCTRDDGTLWDCGVWATAQVTALLDAAPVTCTPLDTDRYGRTVARCLQGDEDIAALIVSRGLALAYRDYSWDYDLHEKSAQVAGVGLWSGSFQTPADWRADRNPAPQPAAQPASGDCIIKGNISSSGRIFHQPHNRDYDDTRIDPDRGERWFCTPDEAIAAGWRAARN
jgi:endonuclease YncB( thermonuclease family)